MTRVMAMPSAEALVSTIIPVFNRPQMVQRAVQSVVQQTHRPIEILVVDDGSSDDTPAVLSELQDRHPQLIRVLHQANPHCAIAYGTARLVDAGGRVLADPSRRTAEQHTHLFPLLLKERWWHTHTPLYRRSISDAAGPWLGFRPEDWDLEARMGALGAQLVHCGSTVSCQLDHDSTARVSRGSAVAYLHDEARFLPRLAACAPLAGVAPEAPHWQHLARWCFWRARQLHRCGATAQGDRLFALLRQGLGGRGAAAEAQGLRG